MSTDILKRAVSLAVLCLVQVLVLNQMHLFDCATPLLYVYMAILFPVGYPRWAVLLWCFALGLVIDTFSNTPGVASASMTLVGAIQPYVLGAFVQRDAAPDMAPSMRSIGVGKYISYVLILVVVYCLCFFSLEAFSFFNWMHWLECIGGSAVFTMLFIFTIESVRRK